LKRKNIIIAAAAVAALLAAAYPASSWYLGTRIEATLGQIDAKIDALPFLNLVRHDYQRGVFGAEETLTFEIPAALLRLPPPRVPAAPETEESPDTPESPEARQEAPPAPAALPPLRITLKNVIRHGPLVDSGAFAAASATTVIEFDEAVQKKIQEAFGGKPPAQIRTLYHFDGGGRSTITSPAFSVVLPGKTEDDQATLSGDGLEMTVEFTRGMERYTMRGAAPRFELSQADGPRLTLTGLKAEADQQRPFADETLFYVGALQFSLAALEIDPGPKDGQAESAKIALKEIKYDTQTSVSGEFIDLISRLGAAELRVGGQDYGPAAYDLSMKHLRARTLIEINHALMALYTQPETLRDQERLLQALAPMKDKFIALLLDDSVLSIDRIAFRLPEGEAKFNLSVKLVDAKPGDFANPLILMGKLDATAELALPGTLIKMLAMANDKTENEEEAQKRDKAADELIANLAELGYIAIDNGILKSRLALKEGQLRVNDKPFNPLALR
jgi:uncharacterized protein YdgA (DUF945 family)